MQHFKESSTQGENKAMLIANALFEGDCESAKTNLKKLLKGYLSVRDFATKAKKENFYHGFLSCVFTNCSDSISDYQSNSESGDGYADIVFKNDSEDTVVILELKASKNIESVIIDAKNAIKQIDDKEYAKSYITHQFVNKIYSYGISFYKKDCYIELKKIK